MLKVSPKEMQGHKSFYFFAKNDSEDQFFEIVSVLKLNKIKFKVEYDNGERYIKLFSPIDLMAALMLDDAF